MPLYKTDTNLTFLFVFEPTLSTFSRTDSRVNLYSLRYCHFKPFHWPSFLLVNMLLPDEMLTGFLCTWQPTSFSLLPCRESVAGSLPVPFRPALPFLYPFHLVISTGASLLVTPPLSNKIIYFQSPSFFSEDFVMEFKRGAVALSWNSPFEFHDTTGLFPELRE